MNDEWNTPRRIIRKVKRVMGHIDLDPMSNDKANRVIRADRFYTKHDNGLLKTWHGKVFLNPPYSQKLLKQSLNQLSHQFIIGNITEFICLTNSSTDSMWDQILQPYLRSYTRGRFKFKSAIGLPSVGVGRGQCFTYAGPNTSKFIYEFTNNNFCWIPNLHLFA